MAHLYNTFQFALDAQIPHLKPLSRIRIRIKKKNMCIIILYEETRIHIDSQETFGFLKKIVNGVGALEARGRLTSWTGLRTTK